MGFFVDGRGRAVVLVWVEKESKLDEGVQANTVWSLESLTPRVPSKISVSNSADLA